MLCLCFAACMWVLAQWVLLRILRRALLLSTTCTYSACALLPVCVSLGPVRLLRIIVCCLLLKQNCCSFGGKCALHTTCGRNAGGGKLFSGGTWMLLLRWREVRVAHNVLPGVVNFFWWKWKAREWPAARRPVLGRLCSLAPGWGPASPTPSLEIRGSASLFRGDSSALSTTFTTTCLYFYY